MQPAHPSAQQPPNRRERACLRQPPRDASGTSSSSGAALALIPYCSCVWPLLPQDLPSADFEITMKELRDACIALRLTLARDRHGYRQFGRRSKSERFKMSSSQKLIATSYRAARDEDKPVDYVRMSNSCHFCTFKPNPEKLKALGPH
ncbi:hypothetical protein GQ600_20209 [Phytophthora cactorum]|nr:hypothetical protein GQ600_20209 [Phytophthora cactorum]